jgi:hypothetical protein
MYTQFSAHSVNRIAVNANSALGESGSVYWWQELDLFDEADRKIGRVVLFLTRPDVALPVGDQPPYWGMDLSKPLAMENGEAPF